MPHRQQQTLWWLSKKKKKKNLKHIQAQTHTPERECLTGLVYHESLCWLFQVMSTAVRPEGQGEGREEEEEDVMWLAHFVFILSLCFCFSLGSSLFFLIQLSSKALYWHDWPKLTIQLEGFTLQSLPCCVSSCLSLSGTFPQHHCRLLLILPTSLSHSFTVFILLSSPLSISHLRSLFYSLVDRGRSSLLCLQARVFILKEKAAQACKQCTETPSWWAHSQDS